MTTARRGDMCLWDPVSFNNRDRYLRRSTMIESRRGKVDPRYGKVTRGYSCQAISKNMLIGYHRCVRVYTEFNNYSSAIAWRNH